MNLLAIDTSTAACSAALLVNDQIFSSFEVQPNQHSRILLPIIEDLIAKAGWEKAIVGQKLDAIAFGCGPGSFTGLRIAASVAQGIAFAYDLPVIPISSLQAMAQTAYEERGYKNILAAIDAHAKSMYYGIFTVEERENFESIVNALSPEVLIAPVDFKLPQNNDKIWHAVGSGWNYFDEFSEKSNLISVIATYYPKASAILTLAKKLFREKSYVSPEQALPVYLHELHY